MRPNWLPEKLVWVGPTKRNESPDAKKMTPAEFLTNERHVLRAAYEFAGYDVDVHISAEKCLSNKTQKELPLRIPQKPFAPPMGVSPNPILPEASFIPVHPPFLGTTMRPLA